MNRRIVSLCALAVCALFFLAPLAALADSGAVANGYEDEAWADTYDDRFWRVARVSDLRVTASVGDGIDDIDWPATAIVRVYTTFGSPAISDEYEVLLMKPEQEDLDEDGIDLSRPSENNTEHLVYLRFLPPVEWEERYQNCWAYTPIIDCFVDVIAGGPIEPEREFRYDGMSVFTFDVIEPSDWPLKGDVECFIYDAANHIWEELGSLPIMWDFESAVYRFDNADFQVIYGTVTFPEDIDIDGVADISADRTARVSASVEIFAFNPIRFLSGGYESPEFRRYPNGRVAVVFYTDYISDAWSDDLHIWFTDDDGRTFVNIRNAMNVYVEENGYSSAIDISGLEMDRWYGLSLQLTGAHIHAGITETVYFMFTEDSEFDEPSGGDRNGAGRWPFVIGGNREPEEPPPTPKPAPSEPNPTPSPVPTPSPSPVPTPVPAPAPSPSPLPEPAPLPAPSPSAEPEPSPNAEPEPEPLPVVPEPLPTEEQDIEQPAAPEQPAFAGQPANAEPLPVAEQPGPSTEARPLPAEPPAVIEPPVESLVELPPETEPPSSEEPPPTTDEQEADTEEQTEKLEIENDSQEDEPYIIGVAGSIPPQGGGGVSVSAIMIFVSAALSVFGITFILYKARYNPVKQLLKLLHLL